MRVWSLIGLAVILANESLAFKAHDFKTCSQSGFCRRGRALSARAKAAQEWTSPYSLDPQTLEVDPNRAHVKAKVKNSLYPDITFGLDVQILEDDTVRVRMDEVGGLRQRYDGAADWALLEPPRLGSGIGWSLGRNEFRLMFGPESVVEFKVQFAPLKLYLTRSGREEVVINGDGFFNMEHFRQKTQAAVTEGEKAEETTEGEKKEETTEGDSQVVLSNDKKEEVNTRAWFEGDTEDAYWEETFGQWTDSKPKGMLWPAHWI